MSTAMKKLFSILPAILFLSSCVVTHTGSISSSSIGKNVVYEDIALGVSQSNKLLGLGGVSQDAMVLEAKRELIKNRSLKSNEEYVNFTVDFKKTVWPLFVQDKITVTADVVRFTNDTTKIYSDAYKHKVIGNPIPLKFFNIGDSIYDNHYSLGIISNILNPHKVRIFYKTKQDKLRSKTISIYDIYAINKANGDKKPGELYGYTDNKGRSEVMKIVAVGLKSILIRDRTNNLRVVKY
jgi:hypothetical protein